MSPPEDKISPRDFARALRKEPSRAERALWKSLRDKKAGAKFRRQHPILPFVADFACVEAKLIVEVDGPSHSVAEQIAHDAKRTAFLEAEGWRVLRVRDVDVLSNPSGVLQQITNALAPSP
jgi:very-short-patch-repair endonuclease